MTKIQALHTLLVVRAFLVGAFGRLRLETLLNHLEGKRRLKCRQMWTGDLLTGHE
jgi:hypothetical protein